MALDGYGRGEWGEAERLCRLVLQKQPEALPALNLLGIIAAQTGRSEEAAGLLAKVIAANPNDPVAHANLGNVLKALGKRTEALACYDRALALAPAFADAWSNRGVALGELGRYAEALQSYDRAISLAPGHADAHGNRGGALRALGRRGEAVQSYDRAIAIRPAFADAWKGRGIVLQELGRHLEALECHERAVELRPGDADAHNSRGNALRDLGRLSEALQSYDRAIALRPEFSDAYNNRGVVLSDLGRHAEALESYDRALALVPAHAHAHGNRGTALRALGRREQALECFDRAIAIDPGSAQAHHDRGVVLKEVGRLGEALESHGRAIAVRAGYAEAYCDRGAVLDDLGRHEEALADYDRAIALKPDHAPAHHNRGNALRALRRYEEAIESYARAQALRPRYEWLGGTLIHTRMQVCDWRGLQEDRTRLLVAVSRGEKAAMPFVVLTLPGTPLQQRMSAETWVRETCPTVEAIPHAPVRRLEGKLRVAYVSADFREHAVSRAVVELLELHDRTRFELTAFSLSPDGGDALRRRVAAAFDRWIDVHDRSDGEVADIAARIGIDIAVDLGGFTQGSRAGIFARRAAPLQVSYLGYPGTMGAPYMDYLIADRVLVPEDHRQHFAEKIIYLPSFQANDTARVASARLFGREELGLPREGFVFCCLNNTYKISPETFDSWMRILQQVEGSVLFLYAENGVAPANLRKEAAARGVDGGRLVFGERLPADEYLSRYRVVDLFLDTLPYNAGVTASDALWMGVPVLTCLGGTFAGRMAASLLTAIGMPELVARTAQEYEAIAVRLATQPAALQEVRAKLGANRRGSLLFDTRRQARNIESAFVSIHERYLAGLPPDHVHIET